MCLTSKQNISSTVFHRCETTLLAHTKSFVFGRSALTSPFPVFLFPFPISHQQVSTFHSILKIITHHRWQKQKLRKMQVAQKARKPLTRRLTCLFQVTYHVSQFTTTFFAFAIRLIIHDNPSDFTHLTSLAYVTKFQLLLRPEQPVNYKTFTNLVI